MKSIRPDSGGESNLTGNSLSLRIPMSVKYLATRSSKEEPQPNIRVSLGTMV